MSVFSDPATTTKLEQIEDRALPPSVPIIVPSVLTLGFGAAAFVVSGGSGLVVACVVAPPITYGYQKIRDWMRAKRFEREHDSIAHLIRTDRDMIGYIKVVGEAETARQLLLALEEGQTLSRPAQKAAKYLLKPESLPSADVAKWLAAQAEVIEAEAETVSEPALLQGGTMKDIVTAWLEELRCSLLVAPPRAGKGIVAAAIMSGFKLAFPLGQLFSCTIKQFQPEDWYFAESDHHINPDRRNALELAQRLYQLYRDWEASESSKDAPSLLVLDELRDTLLAIANINSEEVDPALTATHAKFADWLRAELITAASLDQCHYRFILLISPVSTAQAMTFKDANSLNAYNSYTLVTRNELAFTEGNNGTFAAPAIAANDPLFEGWRGLAWVKKTRSWVGVPELPAETITAKEAIASRSTPITVTNAFTNVIDNTKSTAPKPTTDQERQSAEVQQLYQQAMQRLEAAPGESISITKLIPNASLRKRLGSAVIQQLADNPTIVYQSHRKGAIVQHLFSYGTEEDHAWATAQFVDSLQVADLYD